MANPNGNPQNLRNGGTNKGGPGRPTNKVRAMCLEGFEKSIPFLKQVVNDTNEPTKTRLDALDMLGKYGGLQRVDVTSDDEKINQVIMVDV